MAGWSNTKSSNSAPIFAAAQLNKAPNTSNRDALYNNSTANDYHTGETHSVVGIKASNMGTSEFVIGVDVTAAGNGYTALPTVTFSNGTVNATGNCYAKVNAFTLNGPGTGGSYVPGEIIIVNTGTAVVNGSVNVVATELRTVTVVNAGQGYANNDVVTLDTGTGTAATFTVTTGASTTNVASLALTTRGNYTANPTLANCTTTSANTAQSNGLTVTVTTRIKTIASQNTGAFSVLPTVSGGGTTGSTTGTGATLDLTIGVERVNITNSGSGYTSAPTVTFGGTGGTGSNGTALISNSAGSLANPGWILQTVGSGGRAGRTQTEVLVASRYIS